MSAYRLWLPLALSATRFDIQRLGLCSVYTRILPFLIWDKYVAVQDGSYPHLIRDVQVSGRVSATHGMIMSKDLGWRTFSTTAMTEHHASDVVHQGDWHRSRSFAAPFLSGWDWSSVSEDTILQEGYSRQRMHVLVSKLRSRRFTWLITRLQARMWQMSSLVFLFWGPRRTIVGGN